MKGLAQFGAIIVTLILIAIPIITTVSFCLHWDNFIKWLLTIVAAGEIFLACISAYWYVDEHYDD